VSYHVCLDTANNYAYAGIVTVPYPGYAANVSVAGYDTPSLLDGAVFYFCNDGTNSASCDFSDTIISYKDSPRYLPYAYVFGLFRILFSIFLIKSPKLL